MKNISVILVEPEDQGNIGAVARVMKNFCFSDLRIVNPKCEIGEIAKVRAKHGLDILENARIFDSFDMAIEDIDILIGTTGKRRNYFKEIISPENLINFKDKIGILFGRESIGLLKEEIEKCDFLVTIPANPEYPILNLSHAVAIILYEIYKNISKKEAVEFKNLNNILNDSDSRTLKKVILRANPTQKEIDQILGFLKKFRNKN